MRRNVIVWMLLLSLLVGLFAGCSAGNPVSQAVKEDVSPNAGTADRQNEETGEGGGTYGIAWQSNADLHPYTSTSVTNRPIIALCYESLFIVTGTFATEAMLCERCAVSADGQTWRFTIKEGIKFSDGSELTAKDVRASIQSAMRSAVYGVRFDAVTSVETDGTYGLVITLDFPMENLPQLLDIPIVSADTVSDSVPIGSGPYYLSGETLLRNPHYDRTEFSAVTAEQFDLIEANNSMEVRNAFEFGGADLAYTDPISSNASEYHCDYELWSCPTTVMQYIGFNKSSQFFANVTLRSGVTYAIDRATILAEDYGGFGQAATLACSPLSPRYDNALADLYGYNLGGFQSMQINSGLRATSAQPVRLIVNSNSAKRVAAAERIAAAMGEVGFVVEVDALEEGDFREALTSGYFDLYLGEIRLPTNLDLSCFFSSAGSANYGSAFNGTALELCKSAMKNEENTYNLLYMVVRNGLICPIMFKTDGLYATRGVLGMLSPSVSNLFVSGTGVPWQDILEVSESEEASEEESEEETEETSEEQPEE